MSELNPASFTLHIHRTSLYRDTQCWDSADDEIHLSFYLTLDTTGHRGLDRYGAVGQQSHMSLLPHVILM